MKYHTLFFFKNCEKCRKNLLSAAVVIGALRVKPFFTGRIIHLVVSFKFE